jgi:small subunit ribosomal protein S17
VEAKKIKTLTAVVVSKSGDKSIKAAIDYKARHPKYGKYVQRRSIFGVHDEHNKAGVGDVVEVVSCRPYSKSKKFRLVKIVAKASVEDMK